MAGLVDNALDFLERAFSELQASPKYSVIHFYAAVELLLKARLLAEHWSLVIAKPQDADQEKFLRGDFQSVTMDDAIRRLDKIVGSGLTPVEVQQVQRLGRHRNRTMHFFHSAEGAAGAALREDIAAEQLRTWHTLNRLLLDRWRDVFRPWDDRLFRLDDALKGHRDYLLVRYEAIKEELIKKEEGGARLTVCPSCEHPANEVISILGALGNGQCHVCGEPSIQVETKCPGCSAMMTFVDDGFQTCTSCGRNVEPEELAQLIDEDEPGTKSYYEKGLPGHCNACGGFRTVVHHGGECLCASCFSIFTEDGMAPCSWCGEVNAGKPNNDFHDGCAVCYGGRLPDDD